MSRLSLILRHPSGLIGGLILATLMLMAFVGPLLVLPATQAHVEQIYQSPSPQHPLGTDFQGRDNLVLLIHGGRDVIILALVAGLLTTLAACAIGASSAWFGGAIDRLLMTATDIWLTLPRFLILVVLASLARLDDVWSLALLLAMFGWPSLARQIRAQVLSLKRREYVEAARQLDLGAAHIIFRELLPNMLGFITISLIAAMIQAIYAQTGLVFLGVVPFGKSWGVLFSLAYAKNAIYLPSAAWSLLAPMGAIIL
ncbi:MAG: ABC transporter permease, partial [Chloroflexi bacterium]|nr:ABC transporter permease [Chloroflexota bacterium]